MLDFLLHYVAPYFNFLLFLGIVIYFGKKPIQDMFRLKSEQYSKDAHATKTDFEKIALENNSLRDRLKNLKQEIELLKSDNQRTIDSYVQQSTEQTSEQVLQMQSDLQKTIETEFNLKKREINQKLVQEANQTFKSKLEKEGNQDTKNNYMLKAIKELQGSSLDISPIHITKTPGLKSKGNTPARAGRN